MFKDSMCNSVFNKYGRNTLIGKKDLFRLSSSTADFEITYRT